MRPKIKVTSSLSPSVLEDRIRKELKEIFDNTRTYLISLGYDKSDYYILTRIRVNLETQLKTYKANQLIADYTLVCDDSNNPVPQRMKGEHLAEVWVAFFKCSGNIHSARGMNEIESKSDKCPKLWRRSL